jgi:hypothetical protein
LPTPPFMLITETSRAGILAPLRLVRFRTPDGRPGGLVFGE